MPWARGEIFALALAGFVISLLAFWPGFMEFDSFDQYAQAIGKEQLNDWHPVILVFVWKLLIFVHDGPQLMLLLQLLLYWSGFLYLALHLLQRDKPWLAVAAIQGDLRSNSVWLLTFVWPAHENHVSTERGEASACHFAGLNSDIRWCDFQESSKRGTTMRSLIVVTILCLTSTPAFACVFHTDCNPGATCTAGVCSDQRGSHNDDPSSGSARDNAPMKRKGKTCYYDSDCSQGRCVKGSGMQGVCIGS